MNENNMNEFNIDNFELNKNYVIEASAGTGKTYNIIEIVSKLLKNNIPLNRILIVTYTDKACSELRNRIKEKLIKINSEEKINNAEIYTIHSFCKTIMDEFPISGNFNSNMIMIDDSKLKEFANDYIRKSDECLKLIENNENSDKDLQDMFINFTKRYYLDRDFKENADVVSYVVPISQNEIDEYLFLKNAKDINEVFSNEKYACLEECLNSLNNKLSNTVKSNQKSLINIKNRINNFNNGFKTSASKFDSDYKKVWDFLEEINKWFAKVDETFKNISILNIKLLQDFYISWIKYKEDNKLIDFSDMIRSMHEECMNNNEFLEQLKSKYKYVIIDEFQDTNQLQYDIFKKIFLCDNHYMIVVGDPKQSIYSFQGTDLNVYNKAKKEIIDNKGIFASLNKNYRTSSKLVDGVNELIGSFKDENSTNTFNSFNDFIGSTSVNYEKDKKEFKTYINDEEINQPIWIATDKGDDNNIIEIDEDKYSDIIVSKIVELCSLDESGKTKLQVEEKTEEKENNKRNVSFKDFCILCSKRSELEKIIYKLKKYGIPYLQYKDSKLFKGRECAHFKAILESILVSDFTGENRKIYNKALYTDFFGLDLAKISSSYSSRDDTDEMKKLIKWRKIASKYDWAELIDALLNDSNLRRNNSGSSKMQSLFNYIQIGQYILNSLTNVNNLDKVLKRLNNLSKSNSSDDEEDNVALVERATDFDAVKIMTMHSSKGLEFPIVISAGGLNDLLKNNKVRAYIHHDNDKPILTLGRYSSDEEIEEQKRLFYVAYTRAKYLLIAPLYKVKKSFKFINESLKKMIDNKSNYINIINPTTIDDLKDKVSKILSYEKDITSSSNEYNNDNEKEKLISSKSSQLTHKHSYSSLTHSNSSSIQTINEDINEDLDDEEIVNDLGYNDKEGLIDLNNELSKYDLNFKEIKLIYDSNSNPIKLSDNFPRGNRIGTILHEVLEKVDFKDYSTIDDLIKECFKHEGLTLKDEWINDVKNIVNNVLKANLKELKGSNETSNTFSLNELDKNARQCEIEFNFNFKENTIKDYCNGFIDLIFQRGEYYSILDWKSDSLNEEENFTSYSNYDSLSKHTAKHYAIQRVLYSYTLIKYLNVIFKDKTLEETFNKHFGGIYYVYLKGCNEGTFNGIYCQTWESFSQLENAYNKIVKEKVEKEIYNG